MTQAPATYGGMFLPDLEGVRDTLSMLSKVLGEMTSEGGFGGTAMRVKCHSSGVNMTMQGYGDDHLVRVMFNKPQPVLEVLGGIRFPITAIACSEIACRVFLTGGPDITLDVVS